MTHRSRPSAGMSTSGHRIQTPPPPPPPPLPAPRAAGTRGCVAGTRVDGGLSGVDGGLSGVVGAGRVAKAFEGGLGGRSMAAM